MAGEPRVNPVPIAFQAARMGLSAREGLLAAREMGVKIRDATWFKIYSEIKANTAFQVGEAAELLTGFPRAGQIGELRTKIATGYLQYAQVYVRDQQTGVVSTRPFAVRSQTLITRGAVVEKALNSFTANATPSGNYAGEQVIGAAYTATHQLFPQLPGEEL